MKRIFPALLALMMLLTLTSATAAEPTGSATPGMEMSLEEAAKQGLLSTEDLPEVSLEPFTPEGMEKAIVGTDDRVTVSNTGAYPYSAIANLRVTGACGCNWSGSGFMVSRDCLMTASHCVFCEEHEQSAEFFVMYFGYKSDKNYLLKYDGETNYWYGNRPTNGSYSREWDFAFIKLQKPVGDTTGWFGIASMNDAALSGTRLEVAGYRDGLLKKSWGATTIENQYVINYDSDTVPGNSGCPVFTSDNYAVAIHVANVTDKNDNGLYNVGRRLTQDLVNEMRGLGMFN